MNKEQYKEIITDQENKFVLAVMRGDKYAEQLALDFINRYYGFNLLQK